MPKIKEYENVFLDEAFYWRLDMNKKETAHILVAENKLLDLILESQGNLHNCVVEKNWNNLESTIVRLNRLSDTFQCLEKQREEFCEGENLAQLPEFAKILRVVRGKLLKSKVENKALTEYITVTRKFLNGIFDEAIPSRKNVTYGRNGFAKQGQVKNLVLNVEC